MPLRADAREWSPQNSPNPAERQILKRLAGISAQLAKLRQTGFQREGYNLGLGRGMPTYPTEGMSLALPTEQRFNLDSNRVLPKKLLDGGRKRRGTRARRGKNPRRTRRRRGL